MRIFIFCIFLLPFLNSCSRWEETHSQVRKDRANPPNVGVLDEKNGPHALQDQLETGILSLDTDLVRAALEGGANANGEIGEGVTPIFLAVETSRFLPEKYSETDPETDSQTMEKKLRKLVRLLVEYGAELQHREETFGETPIFGAVKWGDARMTAILLENGAKTEAPTAEMQTSGGMTPLRKAVQMKHGAVLDVLLQDPAVQKQISEEMP
ncbi:MAG: ankyrin repeat domain-containing protein, partial [Thermoguttaceae bacterium]|nr:ankyrin repeat domain-containing protein [Thermoguttaceae bacterium]